MARFTTLGWSTTCSMLAPTGSSARMRSISARSASPRASTSPALLMVSPRPIPSLPLKRILNSAGSA